MEYIKKYDRMHSMSVSNCVIKTLFAKSGNVCAICNTPITFESNGDIKVLGEIAHIYPKEKGGARYEDIEKDGIDEAFINSHANLMVLCPNCHSKIDKKPVVVYTVKYLQAIKKKHEEKVQNKFEQNTIDIKISELDIICKKIISSRKDEGFHVVSSDFDIIGIQEKINKNNLSKNVASDIELGLSQAKLIEQYLAEMNQIDILFAINLGQAFKDIYNKLRKLYNGDELYYEIMNNACPNSSSISLRSATNAVVAYLFHECEVFEK